MRHLSSQSSIPAFLNFRLCSCSMTKGTILTLSFRTMSVFIFRPVRACSCFSLDFGFYRKWLRHSAGNRLGLVQDCQPGSLFVNRWKIGETQGSPRHVKSTSAWFRFSDFQISLPLVDKEVEESLKGCHPSLAQMQCKIRFSLHELLYKPIGGTPNMGKVIDNQVKQSLVRHLYRTHVVLSVDRSSDLPSLKSPVRETLIFLLRGICCFISR